MSGTHYPTPEGYFSGKVAYHLPILPNVLGMVVQLFSASAS